MRGDTKASLIRKGVRLGKEAHIESFHPFLKKRKWCGNYKSLLLGSPCVDEKYGRSQFRVIYRSPSPYYVQVFEAFFVLGTTIVSPHELGRKLRIF